MKTPSIKTQLILYLSFFLGYLSLKDRDIAFLFCALIAVISAGVIEGLILYIKNKKLSVSESSIISGLIIGFVLSCDQPWWMFSLASLLAISSKHFLCVNKKHIFNPAAFGIFILIVVFGAQTQWKGTYLWYFIVPIGFYFVYKIRKLEVIIGYSLAALGLFGIQAFLQNVSLWDIFGYLSYFYIFVMLIEPKTTPVKPQAKIVFGIGVGVLIFILTEMGLRFDTELCALLVMNLAAPWLNKFSMKPLLTF